MTTTEAVQAFQTFRVIVSGEVLNFVAGRFGADEADIIAAVRTVTDCFPVGILWTGKGILLGDVVMIQVGISTNTVVVTALR